MGLFFNPRKNKEKWASIVFAKGSSTVGLTEEMLDAATALYVQQHARILYESINLFLTSKNKATRKSRYKLATQHIGSLCSVRRFANKDMKRAIDQAYSDFQIAEDKYKHPNKDVSMAIANANKQRKNDFWETYAELEMIDIFFGDED